MIDPNKIEPLAQIITDHIGLLRKYDEEYLDLVKRATLNALIRFNSKEKNKMSSETEMLQKRFENLSHYVGELTRRVAELEKVVAHSDPIKNYGESPAIYTEAKEIEIKNIYTFVDLPEYIFDKDAYEKSLLNLFNEYGANGWVLVPNHGTAPKLLFVKTKSYTLVANHKEVSSISEE